MDSNNVSNFEDKIGYLTNDNSTDIVLMMQGEYLNSDTVNSNFNIVKEELDSMYEKIRVLEEIIDYSKVYINNEIENVIYDCRELLNDIENMSDMNFNDNKNYITINVPLNINDNSQYVDRDGTSLRKCDIYNGILTINGTIKNNISISNVAIKRSQQVYEHNEYDILKDKPYRTYYLLDESVANGVHETITYNFKKPENINSIKILLSNCKLKNIVYIYENGQEQYETNINSNVVPEKIIKGLRIEIFSTLYKIEPTNDVIRNNNFFDLPGNATSTRMSTIKELEQRSYGIL